MEKTKNIPKIRFKGYKDEWEKKELGTIANVYDGTHQTPNYTNRGIMFLSVENIKTLKSNKYISEEDFIKNYSVYPEKGDVLMTRIGDVGTSNVIASNEQLAYYVSLALIKPFNINSFFLNYSIGSNFVKNEISIRTLTTAVPKKINMGEISKILIPLPNKEEQKQIGSLFKNLDEKLELEREKHEKLVNFKKAMLENVFPKEGEKRPKIRFGDYNDDWEENYLGEYCKIQTGKLDANAMDPNGKYDFFTSGIKKFKINTFAFEGPSITIAGNGATVGYMHFADGKFNAYQRTYVLNNFTIDRLFVYYEVKNKLYKKIQEESREGSIPYIIMEMLTDLKISIPSINEQKLIGSFFKNLDEKIQVSEEKISKIENFKKAMMDGLFV